MVTVVADIDGAVHIDRAAMQLDDLADRGQAEADAEILRREQRFEDARQHVRRNAGAGIDDGEPRDAVRRFRNGR